MNSPLPQLNREKTYTDTDPILLIVEPVVRADSTKYLAPNTKIFVL